MSSISFNTANSTFRQLLGNGLEYKVPSFQRDYSWTEDEWDDLWQDILALFDEDAEKGHYMGYLVLQSENNKHFKIIDGQQRITSISILILASLGFLKILAESNIDSEKNKKRLENLRQSYIGYVDPVTLVSRPKLKLNRHNNKYFINYLVPLEKLPQRRINASEQLLKQTYEYFLSKLENKFGKKEESGTEIASFIDQTVDKLFFTVITVNDELNAFTVFETLNSRGVKLSSTDLLKNYIFSIITKKDIHELEVKKLEDIWERILGSLGNNNFSEFLRCYWNSSNRLTRKTDLFKTIRKKIKTEQDAFNLLRALDELAPIYVALRDPNDSLWNDKEKDAIRLFNIAQVRQPYTILLSLYSKFYENERELFTKAFDALKVITFRYNIICNFHTNEQEKIYSIIAQNISQGNYTSLTPIFNTLKELYPNDDVFKSSFSQKELRTTTARNKKVLVYIFAQIEKNNYRSDFNIESNTYNIEHILPENPSDEWNYISDEKQDQLKYRIGNMTLLESTFNKEIGNLGYEQKKESFKESKIKITQYISEHFEIWDEDKIISRQKHLAKSALGIWKIPQFNQ